MTAPKGKSYGLGFTTGGWDLTQSRRITVTRVTGVTLALALALALAVPSGLSPPDASAGFSRASLERIAIQGLGFATDAVPEWDRGLVPVNGNWSAFGIGGNASVPATLDVDDVPWIEPISLGVNILRWTDPDLLPTFANDFEINGMLSGPGNLGGPRLDATYLVGTLIMGDDIPFDFPRNYFAQFDLVLDIPGRDKWQALDIFPNDSWDQGSYVLSLRLDFDTTSLNAYSFSSGNIITEQRTGFAYGFGTTIVFGVEVDETTFPEGRANIRGGIALDVRGPGFPPEEHVVVVAPEIPRTETGFFDYLGMTRVLTPGYPGMLDFTSARLFEGSDGTMLFGLTPRVAWDGGPPMGYFSDFLRVGFAPVGGSPAGAFGFQTHDGIDETFKEEAGSRTASPGLPAFVTQDGEVIIGTDLPVGVDDGSIYVQTGFLREETSTFQTRTDQFPVTADDVITWDPDAPGSAPIYDLATGTEIAPPPTTTTTPATTTTTVPVSSGGADDSASCGWCWVVPVVWALVLVVLIFWRLRLLTWWICWIAWFLVIVAWVPLLLAGLWFWYPAWWWWPLLAWYPLVLGYGVRWAPNQTWWRPNYRFLAPAYLVVLAVATYLVGRPEWWLLFLLYWLPPLVFYGWARGRFMTWWRPFGLPLLIVHFGFILVWTRWLTPAWFLWFFVVLIAVLGWWFVIGGRRWSLLVGQKWTWILGFVLVPILAFAIALWCSWWCWLTAFLFLAWLLGSWRHGFWLGDPAPNGSADRAADPAF